MSERVDACAYDAEVRKAERVVLFVLGLCPNPKKRILPRTRGSFLPASFSGIKKWSLSPMKPCLTGS